MSRLALPLEAADLSAFARALRSQLDKLEHTPGHLELLNMLCRAAGFRNYQHFRASAEARQRLAAAREMTPAPDYPLVEKAARHFDGEGRLLRWPAKAPHLKLCWHVFGDPAVLRQALFEAGLVDRTQDGRQYRRIEQKPPVELGALLARVTTAAA
jgi:DNA-binding transcriptional ArsR family regulator